MDWIQSMQKSINYIEDHIFENYNEYPFEMQRKLLGAIGWKAEVHSDIEHMTKEQIRQDYVNSINKGVLVLLQGITNDGCKHNYNVFYGYEDDGKRIIG